MCVSCFTPRPWATLYRLCLHVAVVFVRKRWATVQFKLHLLHGLNRSRHARRKVIIPLFWNWASAGKPLSWVPTFSGTQIQHIKFQSTIQTLCCNVQRRLLKMCTTLTMENFDSLHRTKPWIQGLHSDAIKLMLPERFDSTSHSEQDRNGVG